MTAIHQTTEQLGILLDQYIFEIAAKFYINSSWFEKVMIECDYLNLIRTENSSFFKPNYILKFDISKPNYQITWNSVRSIYIWVILIDSDHSRFNLKVKTGRDWSSFCRDHIQTIPILSKTQSDLLYKVETKEQLSTVQYCQDYVESCQVKSGLFRLLAVWSVCSVIYNILLRYKDNFRFLYY